jgi:hypothetical protein
MPPRGFGLEEASVDHPQPANPTRGGWGAVSGWVGPCGTGGSRACQPLCGGPAPSQDNGAERTAQAWGGGGWVWVNLRAPVGVRGIGTRRFPFLSLAEPPPPPPSVAGVDNDRTARGRSVRQADRGCRRRRRTKRASRYLCTYAQALKLLAVGRCGCCCWIGIRDGGQQGSAGRERHTAPRALSDEHATSCQRKQTCAAVQ